MYMCCKTGQWRSTDRLGEQQKRISLGSEDGVARDSLEEHLITSRNLPVSLETGVARTEGFCTHRVGDKEDGVERSGHEATNARFPGRESGGPLQLLSRTAKLHTGRGAANPS